MVENSVTGLYSNHCSRLAEDLLSKSIPVSILYKSTAGRYRPVRVADRPITARCRFIKNVSWVFCDNSGIIFSNFS